MATESLAAPIMADPSFSRPTSLYHPEIYTPSLIDSSSYSPFPVISGARTDPFGLNAYLLHPEDDIWSYIAPAAREPYFPGNSRNGSTDRLSQSEGTSSGDGAPRKGLRRLSSSVMLKKSSPLAQPPVTVLSPTSGATPRLQRRRSKSLDSSSPRAATIVDRGEVIKEVKTLAGNKKGISRFFARRKSIPNIAAAAHDIPPVPTLLPSAILTPASSTSDLFEPPSKPDFGSRRSSSIISEGDSLSSASSADGLPTPKDSPRLQPAIEDGLLIHTEDGSLRRKGFKGWFNRRSSKLPDSSNPSPTSTANPSPTSIDVNLPTLAISPARSADPPSRVNPTPDQKANAFMLEHVRRSSYRKLGQLRRPSPHPLAQHLRRQATNLPNELASAFELGQKVFPRSVNTTTTDSDTGLAPAQRGLFCLLGVKIVLDQLDKGLVPSGPVTKRPSIPASIPEIKRQRSMRDFVRRRPFEDRNHVYYAGGQWSPVSIARPGFGVWDLDFSAYILALADVGEVAVAWPNLPRPSFGGVDELTEDDERDVEGSVLSAMMGIGVPVLSAAELPAEAISSGSEEGASSLEGESEVLITPSRTSTPPAMQVPEIRIVDDTDTQPRAISSGSSEQARSSFRLSNRIVEKTWDDSESESDNEEDQEDEDLPLSNALRKSSMPALSQRPSTVPVQPPSTSAHQSQGHTRRFSQPLPGSEGTQSLNKDSQRRRSQFDLAGLMGEEDKQMEAMAEVARARERRQALMSGEIDRKADGEHRRAEESKQRSQVSSSHSSVDVRKLRQQSNSSLPPASSPSHLRPQHPAERRRYHSFYELSPQSSSASRHPSPVLAPVINTYHQSSTLAAGMAYQNQLNTRGSLMFYPQPHMSPPIHPGQMAFQYPQHAFAIPTMPAFGIPQSYSAGSFGLMPHSRSSTSLPNQARQIHHVSRTQV